MVLHITDDVYYTSLTRAPAHSFITRSWHYNIFLSIAVWAHGSEPLKKLFDSHLFAFLPRV